MMIGVVFFISARFTVFFSFYYLTLFNFWSSYYYERFMMERRNDRMRIGNRKDRKDIYWRLFPLIKP